MHTWNILFEFFFEIHLKCTFIIGAFAPMSQNTMSLISFLHLRTKDYVSLYSFMLTSIYNHLKRQYMFLITLMQCRRKLLDDISDP
jgi:hypothetical protein